MGNRRGKKGKKKKRFPKEETKTFQTKIFPFPFLEHNATIDSIKKQFRVMFIMRGLPGSGKSTLIKEIVKIYPNAVICSADNYFMENDEYVWSAERRFYAHRYSKNLAAKCCEMNCPVLIIDNTNITEIEIEIYFQIAMRHSYVTVLVIPQTPWSFDPVELVKHGQHNVSLESLKIKLKHFQDIIPVFYAWVLGQQDAEELKTLAIRHFQECLKHIPQLGEEISKLLPEEESPTDKQKDGGLKNHFDSVLKKSLFCVAKNCLKGNAPGSFDYHAKENVQSSCGKVFALQVSKIIVTPHFLLACVELTSQQKSLYGLSESPKKEQSDPYKVAGKSSQEEQTKHGFGLASEGYTDEKLHQSCMEKIDDKLSLMLSKIKLGVGMEIPEENPTTEIEPGVSDARKTSSKEDLDTEEEEKDVEAENKTNNSSSEGGKLASILLTNQKNPVNTHGELQRFLELENTKDCKSFNKISTDDSDIVHINNAVCIVHLKTKPKFDAIFSGKY